MKTVPFFANTPDDTHCVQAAFKMMLKYFIPERDFSFEELDQLSQKQPGKGTWWPPLLLAVQKLGFFVKVIEPFDYARFYREGEAYVRNFCFVEAADYHLNRTNLLAIRPMIPEFLKKADIESRPAEFGDIQNLLTGGWLVAAAVNSRALNDKSGFSGHVVVVYEIDGQTGKIWLHDPGLPERQKWQITRQKFEAAFKSAGAATTAISAVKRA